MKMVKTIAILTIAASISLFANGLSNITTIVDQVNSATDAKEKSALMKKLDIELAVLNMKDIPAAKKIINEKLKK
jgi:hypothetical protein